MDTIPIDANDAEPWHAGERAMQQRAGMRERLAQVGVGVLRGYMPEQHRKFFAQLPFLVAGTVDAAGQPWASALANPPGFIESPDPRHLVVHVLPPPGDPLVENMRPGAAIGLLGIEPHTRRRNRMNGVVESVGGESFSVRVSQSFGNCPKYIQAREAVYIAEGAGQAKMVHRAAGLDELARQMIRRADTFFIATAYPAAPGDGGAAHGVDVSHRGGKPGFVRVDTDGTLTAPDFMGNFYFNTLGNLTVNPRASLLFIDFANGDLLYLTADAEIIWEGAELESYADAQRLLRLRVRQMQLTEGALPLRWGAATLSPFLARMGEWAGN
jgi:predicted pyridoxine 5'-phosphate oxidase superfamily flavin-nucleotide-binding protein